MSTNARIGILNADGTVRAVRLHWSGGETAARTLRTRYDRRATLDLLALGDISELGDTPATSITSESVRRCGPQPPETYPSIQGMIDAERGIDHFHVLEGDPGAWRHYAYDRETFVMGEIDQGAMA